MVAAKNGKSVTTLRQNNMNTNPKAKRILVYGDSYTYGKVPGGSRYDSGTRFTGILQNELGGDYEVIEEGLRGRVISGEHPFFPHRDGLAQFDSIIGSHLPLDLVCLFLGTNDTNSGSTKTVKEIVSGYDKYQSKLKEWCTFHGCLVPKILLITPPIIDEAESYKAFKDIFKGSQPRSTELPGEIISYAKANLLDYYNASEIKTSTIDGIHLDVSANQQLGKGLANKIRTIL